MTFWVFLLCYRVSWYRDTYLQSEDWRNLRAAMIAHYAPDGRCPICRAASPLDVHHWRYRKIWDVHTKDLSVCCRLCHDHAHSMKEQGVLLHGLYQLATALTRGVLDDKGKRYLFTNIDKLPPEAYSITSTEV